MTQIEQNSDWNNDVFLSCDLEGIKILVADDDEFNRTMLHLILKKQKAEVTLCANGSEALEQSALIDFDVILLDNRMPVMSGFEAGKKIRSLLPNSKIIMISGDAYDCQECLKNHDFNDCLPKPFNKSQLNLILSKHLNLKLKNKQLPDFKTSKVDDLQYNFDSILKVTKGKKHQTLELIDLFLQMIEECVENIERGYEERQYGKIVFAAHKLISPLRQIEAVEFVNLLSKVEMTIEMKQDRAKKDVEVLKNYSKLILKALKDFKFNILNQF